MAITSTTNRKTFAGDDATTSFGTSPVVFFNTSDLVIQVVTDATGAATTLTENTHYTVSGGAGTTGTVDLSGGTSAHGALVTGTTLVILRVVPLTQAVDFVNNDINDAEVLEDALDKLTMIDQQQQETLARAVTLPSSESGTMTLPALANRASAYLAFDASGNMIAAADPAAYPASTFMGTVLDDTTATAALATLGLTVSTFVKTLLDDTDSNAFTTTLKPVRAVVNANSRSVRDKVLEVFSLADFLNDDGTVVDPSVADNTTGIQAAINAAANAALYIPQGQFNFSGTITITSPIQIFGASMNSSILAGTGATQDMFSVTVATAGHAPVNFRDLTISSTVAKTAGTAISYNPTAGTQNDRSVIERVSFEGQFTSINFVRAAYWTVKDCYFTSSVTNAVQVTVDQQTTSDSGDQALINNFFNGAGGTNVTHVLYSNGGGLRITANKFLMGSNGIVTGFTASVGTGQLGIVGNNFDGQTSSSISLTSSGASGQFTDINIAGNQFNGAPGTSYIYVSQSAGFTLSRINMSGNQMVRHDAAAPFIILDSGSNAFVSGNLLVGFAAYVGIQVQAGFSNARIGPNKLLGGITISNGSTTTEVTETDAPIAPTLLNSWVDAGGGTQTSAYYKDASGVVHVRGHVKSGVAAGIFTLPAEYRPSAEVKFACVESNALAVVKITAAGSVEQVAGGTTDLSLDGISFTTA